MSRFIFLGLLIVALIFVGLLTLNSGFLMLALPLLVYLFAGLFFLPHKPEISIEREINPNRVPADTPVQVRLMVKNAGSRVEEVFLEDQLPAGVEYIEGFKSLLADLAVGESLELSYLVRARRGVYPFERIQVSLSDLFGVIQHKSQLAASGRLMVLPYIPQIKRVNIRPRQTRMYTGSIPAKQGGSGIDFFGIRNYQAGDPLRIVNWQASARHPEAFYSNEFEQERVATVWLVLDARWRSNLHTEKGALFEYAVSAAAALSQTLLNQGNRVGLLVYGGFLDWTYPGYGRIQKERILRALTRAQPGESLIFDKLENLPARVFPLHSQIMMISPIQNEDLALLVHLRSLGYSTSVISPDPIAFDGANHNQNPEHDLGYRFAKVERKLLLARLQQAGVRVINWDVDYPFEQVMQTHFRQLPVWFHAVGWSL